MDFLSEVGERKDNLTNKNINLKQLKSNKRKNKVGGINI